METKQVNQWLNKLTNQDDYLPVWIEYFLKDRKSQSMAKGTLYFYKKKLELLVKFCDTQAVTRLSQIDPNFIRNYMLWLQERGNNIGGQHQCYRTLKTLLYFWMNEVEPDYKNPFTKTKPPKLANEPLIPVTLDDVKSLLDTCKAGTFIGERNKSLVLCLLETGIRANELLSIDLDDISLLGEILIKQAKGGKFRTVFLGKKTRQALRKYLKLRDDSSQALFVNKSGERLTYFGLREIIRRMSKQAGINKPPSLHSFRRAFCLNQLQNNVPETTIARLMGHSSTILIARYAKQTKRDLREQFVSAVDDRL
jgi:integrase/recombinase XerD